LSENLVHIGLLTPAWLLRPSPFILGNGVTHWAKPAPSIDQSILVHRESLFIILVCHLDLQFGKKVKSRRLFERIRNIILFPLFSQQRCILDLLDHHCFEKRRLYLLFRHALFEVVPEEVHDSSQRVNNLII